MTELPLTILLGLAGFYLGWNIGANDGGNSIGTSIGAGLISFRRGAVLAAIFVVLGAVLQGERVVETVGRRVVSVELPTATIFLALISGGVIVSLASLLRIPVSTSQAVVGGLTGAGLSMGASVNLSVIGGIFLSWVLCPVVAMALSAGAYWVVRSLLRRVTSTPRVERILGVLVVASASYAAFSIGANNAGNAVGPLANLRAGTGFGLLLLGGVSIAAGVITFGRGVAEAIGKGIVPLDLPGALTVQTAAGLAVHLYSLLGMPVSTSHAIVGAVVGVGLLRGIRAVGRRKIAEICVGWVATPTVAGLIAYSLCRVFIA